MNGTLKSMKRAAIVAALVASTAAHACPEHDNATYTSPEPIPSNRITLEDLTPAELDCIDENVGFKRLVTRYDMVVCRQVTARKARTSDRK